MSSTSLLWVVVQKYRKRVSRKDRHGEGIREHLISRNDVGVQKHLELLFEEGDMNRKDTEGTGMSVKGGYVLQRRVCLFGFSATEKSIHRSSYRQVT